MTIYEMLESTRKSINRVDLTEGYEKMFQDLMLGKDISEDRSYMIKKHILKDLKRQMDEQEKTNIERTPKRGEIVEVKNFGTNEYEYGVFIAEIEKEYDGRKYLVDVEGHPITIRKEMRQKQPKEETIYVPDNIRIEICIDVGGDDLCINNGKQSLYYCQEVYNVSYANNEDEVKCKLIPIDVKDLEVGGTYFHTNLDDFRNIDKLSYYCKYLGGMKYVIWREESAHVTDNNRKHRYKVVPVE